MSQQLQNESGLDKPSPETDETSSEQDSSPPMMQGMKQSERLDKNGGGPGGNVDFLRDICDFHEQFGLDYDGKPRILPVDLAKFRLDFNQEELDEWKEFAGKGLMAVAQEEVDQADVTHCLEMMLDAAVDQMYVLLGTIYLQGLAPVFEEAWHRVHRANMAKVRALRDGSDSKRGSAYDVVKPEGWVAPDHSDLVEDHAHQ